jgi:hypothetical protein
MEKGVIGLMRGFPTPIVVMDRKPENGCKLQTVCCGTSGIMMSLRVKTLRCTRLYIFPIGLIRVGLTIFTIISLHVEVGTTIPSFLTVDINLFDIPRVGGLNIHIEEHLFYGHHGMRTSLW